MSQQRTDVRELVVALTLATLAQTLIAMAVYAPAVLAPAAQSEIGLTATAIGIFTALVFVAAAYAAPLGGARVVRSGPVRVSQLCLLWAAGGMALFISAVPAVIAAGALAIGLGYGPATPASSAMLSQRTPDRLRNVIMSIRQSGVTLGGALAGALLPALAVAYGWRAAALVVVVLCVVCAALLQIVRDRYDAGRTGVRQAGHGSHLFLLRMVFKQAELRQGAFTSFTYAGAQMCFGSFLVVFLTERAGMSLIDAGAAYSAAMLSGIAGRMVWGALADYFDCARLVLGMLGLTMTLCAFVITLVSPQWPYTAVIALCMACGASAFGWNGVYIAEVARITSGENVALATGAVITFNFLGIVIAPVAFWLTVLLSGSYVPAFVLIGLMALAGSLPYFRENLVMTPTLTHVVFKVGGEPDVLAAFDARLKLLFAEHGIGDECEEQHAPGALHYDIKVRGGIPFPPFALASSEFPELTVTVEWIDAGSAVRGTATIARGALTEQKVENLAGTGAGHAVAINIDAGGYLKLALAVARTGRDECCGYMLTGREDALFRIARDAATGAIELRATEGTPEWSRLWLVAGDGATEYREIDPVQPIADGDFREMEKLAQDFVAQWVWFGNGPREEIAIEAERYERLGYAVSDANLRSAALHRIKSSAGNGGDSVHYSTLDAEIAWVENAIARCWPGT